MDINVIGFGVMGKQISALFYLLGCNVSIYHRGASDSQIFLRQANLLKRRIKHNKEGSFSFCENILSLSNSITVESVAEDLEVKKNIYNEVRHVNDKAYFTNTSSYSPAEIAGDVNGLHFFNPIYLSFIELYLARENDADIRKLIEKLQCHDFTIINVQKNRGYIGNYILFHEIAVALKLVEKFNYQPEAIKAVYSKLYDGRDIFAIIDLIGIDVVNNILINLQKHEKSIYVPNILKLAIDKNILGKKNKTSIKSIIDEF